MSRPIAPGQTVPVPFTLSESPDSTPTLTVYQSTAAGVLSDVTATTSPMVMPLSVPPLISDTEYHAFFTVPAAAVHGSAYQLLVSVTIAGETTTHWLDGGTVLLTATNTPAGYALRSDVRAWSGREDAVALDPVSQRVPGGASTLKFLPYVSGNVGRFDGVPADYFLHENTDGTVELNSHVHGMSEDSGIASQASVDALAGDGDTIDGHTTIGALRLMLAALAGLLSGASGTSVSIRAVDDSKTRITATVDAFGNRTAVTLDDT